MHWVWECSRTVGNDRLVLLAIADRASDEGLDAWPSIRNLAKKTRLHERTVQRCIQNIETLGELEVSRTTGPHGCNVYRVRMDVLVMLESSRPNQRKGNKVRQHATPDKLSPDGNSATGGVAQKPPGGDSSATGRVAAAPPDSSLTSLTTTTSKTNTALAREPHDGNYKVIERLAFELVAKGFWEWDGERFDIKTEADLVTAVKDTASRLGIDYGWHPDVATNVVHRACASEWFKHTHPRAVGRQPA